MQCAKYYHVVLATSTRPITPQAYEVDCHRPYDRLIREGADFNTTVVFHDVIFAAGVTIDA
jgi:hypothetical protein